MKNKGKPLINPKMNNKGAITLSLATLVIIILSVVVIGAGIVLLRTFLTATELPALNKGMPQFFQASVYPDKGQIGTVFKINLELENNTGIYLINARIMKTGGIVKTIPLYDDGSHGDGKAEDGNYSNVWSSENENEGIYKVDIIINPSDKQIVYENVSSFKIFRENCEPLIYNGNPDDKVDVAILPYGYSDLNKFKQDALQWITKGLLAYEPFASNQDRFNFYLVNQQSDFTCTRDENTRTLMYCDDSKVEKEASQCPADQIVVLLDDAEFCGTSSSYARACNGWNLRQVLTHEFGHAFGGLGDEYSYSSAYPQYEAIAATYPNCDTQGCGKWSALNIGCFKGCGVDDLYRATRSSCIMYRYVDIFCPICISHITELLNNYKSGFEQVGAAPAAAPPAEKTYLIDLNYDKGNLSFNNIYVTEGKAPDRKALNRFDYTGKIVSFDGKLISSFNFELPNIIYTAPPQNESGYAPSPIILDKLAWTVPASQSDRASKLEIYDKQQKKLLAIDIGYLSNSCGNGQCEAHESAIECPQDCKENVKDDLCNYAKDGICDPDCPRLDPDCIKVNWLLAGLIAISLISIIAIIILTQMPEKEII
jgi:hypothetical protein